MPRISCVGGLQRPLFHLIGQFDHALAHARLPIADFPCGLQCRAQRVQVGDFPVETGVGDPAVHGDFAGDHHLSDFAVCGDLEIVLEILFEIAGSPQKIALHEGLHAVGQRERANGEYAVAYLQHRQTAHLALVGGIIRMVHGFLDVFRACFT